MRLNNGIVLAAFAGFFAASASVLIKIGLSKEKVAPVVCGFGPTAVETCQTVSTVACVISFALGLVANAAMWFLFSKSLAQCDSTVKATTSNTLTNFLFTGLFGAVLFNEPLSLLWCFGISLIVVGLHLLTKSEPRSKTD